MSAPAADVVVALRERSGDRVWIGAPWEQHDDLRRRCELGTRTDGWLPPGFIDRATGEFLDRGAAFRRFPEKAGRTRGYGVADSSDFACIRSAKLRRAEAKRGGCQPDSSAISNT